MNVTESYEFTIRNKIYRHSFNRRRKDMQLKAIYRHDRNRNGNGVGFFRYPYRPTLLYP